MRISDSDILFVPGLGGSGSGHWQSRWAAKLSTARCVEQADWEHPDPSTWTACLVAAATASARPVLLVAHSLGVIVVARALAALPRGFVRGAFLVAPVDVEEPGLKPDVLSRFAPMPLEALPCPSVLVASRTDPYCGLDRAETFASAWGSDLVDAGEAGHLNVEAGFGPWPEGLMRFAGFTRQI